MGINAMSTAQRGWGIGARRAFAGLHLGGAPARIVGDQRSPVRTIRPSTGALARVQPWAPSRGPMS